MANQNQNRDLKQQLINRPAVTYDPIVRAFDTSFWKEIATTVSAAGTPQKVRLTNGGEIASYPQFLFGTFEFAVNIPVAPTAGHARKIGLLLPSAPTKGSIYFEVDGTTFKAVSYDEDGVVQSSTLTFAGAATEKIFKIEWERDFIVFSHDGVAVATHKTRIGKIILPLYFDNSVNDNMDLGLLAIKDTSILTS